MVHDVADGDGGAVGRRHRNLQHVLRPLDQARHLHGEASGRAFQRAGGDQAVGGVEADDELVEREAVAFQQRRIDDDLDRLVARAAQLRRQHAGHLLDRVLGGARDLQHGPLRHLAGQRHHQHRIERQVDLLHARLVGILRQVALGLIDLGAHVGQRRLGIEARLELEQHGAAALVGGRAHFLDVADGLELGLDRPQQQALGILRADAALRELDVDDRDADVRLGLLRDRDIGHEARQQQEQQRDDRQPRVADGVVDEPGHDVACDPASVSAARTCSAAATGLDQIAFANEVLALHDDARAIRHAARAT